VPKKDEVNLAELSREELMAVTLRTLNAIHRSSGTRTPLETEIVEAMCARLPRGGNSKSVNPVDLLIELKRYSAG
jgi:hypothetical protein